MGLFKRIKDALFGNRAGEIRDPDGIYLYVQCDQCGAPVRIRADKRHDLQRDYDTGGYVLHKEVMDGSCFSLMHATVQFDTAHNIVDRQISGGKFITWEKYRALTEPVKNEEAQET